MDDGALGRDGRGGGKAGLGGGGSGGGCDGRSFPLHFPQFRAHLEIIKIGDLTFPIGLILLQFLNIFLEESGGRN